MAERRLSRIGLAAVIALLVPGMGSAQVPVKVDSCPSFSLPLGHWGGERLRRLEALGEAQGWTHDRSPDACRLLHSLTLAGSTSGKIATEAVPTLFLEFPGLGSGDRRLLAFAGEIGGAVRSGGAAPGLGEFAPDRTGALPESDRLSPLFSGLIAVRPHDRLVLVAQGGARPNDPDVQRLEMVFTASPVAVELGRGAVGAGYPRGGSIVLGKVEAFDRVQISTIRPLRLPGRASRVGSFAFEAFAGRVREDRQPGDPYLWGASGSFSPHPRLSLAINRAAFFGGEGRPEVTGERLLNMLIGRVVEVGFENQVVSVEMAVRLPTERLLPLTAYIDWGAEDAAGSFLDVPGRIAGLYTPRIPGLPQWSAGLEYASFEESCCGNPEWYRHWSFPGSWTLHDEVLSHPLGGHGEEWLFYSHFLTPDSRVQLDISAARRVRREENLFVPGREGRSWLGDTSGRWRLHERGEIFGAVILEQGTGWREISIDAGGRFFTR